MAKKSTVCDFHDNGPERDRGARILCLYIVSWIIDDEIIPLKMNTSIKSRHQPPLHCFQDYTDACSMGVQRIYNKHAKNKC